MVKTTPSGALFSDFISTRSFLVSVFKAAMAFRQVGSASASFASHSSFISVAESAFSFVLASSISHCCCTFVASSYYTVSSSIIFLVASYDSINYGCNSSSSFYIPATFSAFVSIFSSPF